MAPYVAADTLNCSKPRTTEVGRRVDSLTYLGSLANGDQNDSEEITSPPIAANRSYFGLKSQFKSQLLSMKIKILIYKTLVRPLLIQYMPQKMMKEDRAFSKEKSYPGYMVQCVRDGSGEKDTTEN